MKIRTEPYYMNVREGYRGPLKTHDTQQEALDEAARLAISENAPIYTLRTTHVTKPKPNTETTIL
jgi:hypothetical protein